MKRSAILLSILFGAVAVNATVTVNYSAGFGDYTLADSTLAALEDGNEVRIGTFDLGFVQGGGLDAIQGLGALGDLGANFSTFGSTSVVTLDLGITQAGSFADSASVGNPVFDDAPIYLWVFRTSDNGSVAGDFSNVTEFGIFGSDNPSWVFPADGSIISTTTISSSEATTAYFGAIDHDNGMLVTAVPEPAEVAAIASSLALALAVWRRRTRQS